LTLYRVENYWRHPDYSKNTTSTYNHPFHGENTMTDLPIWDIALLALRRTLPSMSHYSKAIPLISPDITFPPDVKFVASGWGMKLNPNYGQLLPGSSVQFDQRLFISSDELLATELTLVCENPDGTSGCMKSHESIMWVGPCSQLGCSGHQRIGEGDSGGPLVWPDTAHSEYKLVGISSYLIADGSVAVSGFSNVTSSLDWINCVENPDMCQVPRSTEIGSSFNQDSGSTWGQWDMCSDEKPAVGFAVRHQMAYDNGAPYGDVTGLNSICLVCKNTYYVPIGDEPINPLETYSLKCSQQGPWGTWHTPFKSEIVTDQLKGIGGDVVSGEYSFCPGGFNRIYMQNQKHQGYGVEDVGLYYLGMYCECRNNPSENPCNPDEMIELPNVKSAMQGTNITAGTIELPGVDEFEWTCDPGFVICGVRTLNWNVNGRRRKRKSGNGKSGRSPQDDVGAVGAWFKCCPAPAPTQE